MNQDLERVYRIRITRKKAGAVPFYSKVYKTGGGAKAAITRAEQRDRWCRDESPLREVVTYKCIEIEE